MDIEDIKYRVEEIAEELRFVKSTSDIKRIRILDDNLLKHIIESDPVKFGKTFGDDVI